MKIGSKSGVMNGEMKKFRDKDPDNIYEHLYIIEHHKDGTLSIPEYDSDTFEII